MFRRAPERGRYVSQEPQLIAERLLGAPLATVSRRAWAIGLDMLLFGVLFGALFVALTAWSMHRENPEFFGSARAIEGGGSLTILGTALVDTGSKADEVIFEEFKGTGNMELRLDRKVAERRIYPAIDVDASSTRHEELLFDRKQLQMVWKLRRVLSGLSGGEGGTANAGLELLIDRLRTFNSNAEILAEIAKQPGMG